MMQEPFDTVMYNHNLASLITLMKSNTPQGDRVVEVLKSGKEDDIRRMLQNFGNPEDEIWKDITLASPWADWQINQAIQDLAAIKPAQELARGFWYW